MSRLIDADAFIASLQEYIDKPITAGLVATLVELFPTAYDVEKVVERLEEYKKQWMDSDYLDGVDEIIDIVKRGGVE